MTKYFKAIHTGVMMVLIIAPSLFSQSISRIEFQYYSGISSQDSYAYDMTIKNDGAVDLVFNLKGLNEYESKTTSYGYSYMISIENWNYLTDYILTNGNLIFPGMDTTVGNAEYGSQIFRSKIYFKDEINNTEYFKIPDASLTKMDEVMSPFYSKMKSMIPENIAVDFFEKKRQFYKLQRGELN